MSQEIEQSLRADKLCSGDRSSIIAAGMAVAHSLKELGVCVMSVDALGRVVVLPAKSVRILAQPTVPDADLDALTEDEAIAVMVKEGRGEDEILTYLKTRS